VGPTWDVRRIIDAAGGIQSFSKECAVRGWSITPKSILKWRERSSIPSHGLAAALLVMRDRGHLPDLSTFIHTSVRRPGGRDQGGQGENDQ
jgi:hypothetical protein